MGNTGRIGQNDIERLSAYIDGELPDQERSVIEARLKIEPELRAYRDELLQIRNGLKALPEVRTPRSFTLTPEGLRSKSVTFVFPTLQFATALAALALVFLIGLDFLSGQLPSGTARTPFTAQEMQADAVQLGEMVGQEGDPTLEKTLANELEAPAEAVEGEVLAEEEGVAEAPPEPAAPSQEESGISAGEAVEQLSEPSLDRAEAEPVQPTPSTGEKEASGFEAEPGARIEATQLAADEFDRSSQPATAVESTLGLLLQFRSLLRFLEFAAALGLVILILALVRSRRLG